MSNEADQTVSEVLALEKHENQKQQHQRRTAQGSENRGYHLPHELDPLVFAIDDLDLGRLPGLCRFGFRGV